MDHLGPCSNVFHSCIHSIGLNPGNGVWGLIAETMASMYALTAALACSSLSLKTFGTGRSAFKLTSTELEVFAYNVTSMGHSGVLTHFWITGGPALGSGTDNATVRYYVDGESHASIEFKPPMAAGVGFDDNTVWGTAKIGHGSNAGGWYLNLKVPFASSIRITVTLPGKKAAGCYVIIRGCEDLPVMVGALTLPRDARLRLHKIEGVTFQPGDWVPIVDLPHGDGLVYMTAIQANSSTPNVGAIHAWSHQPCLHLAWSHQPCLHLNCSPAQT